MENQKRLGASAFLPLIVFLALYVGCGITFTLMGVENPFGMFPRHVALLAGIAAALMLAPKVSVTEKLDVFCQSMGNSGVMMIVLIYLMAGGFQGAAASMGGKDSVINLALHFIPVTLLIPGVFLMCCFISTAIGTSMGTIAAMAPVAIGVATGAGLNPAIVGAAVIGGSYFGDNLSMISDTTISAAQGCGSEMKDKFRENFWIALPAALAALALILVISFRQAPGTPIVHEYHLLQTVPYLLVLIGGIAGIQVFVVLLIGIASGAVIMLGTGQTTLWDMLSSMGSGTSGMFETCMVAILVAAMCALIRENGGFTVLLRAIHKIFRGKKGGQLGVGILVALLDIATANNTVAIVMANPIAKQMSEDYGITPRKTASLLDTFSCISQGILPYGAQMLVAISAVHELGYELSAFEIMANLFYPGMLLVSSLIFIFVLPDRKNAESNA